MILHGVFGMRSGSGGGLDAGARLRKSAQRKRCSLLPQPYMVPLAKGMGPPVGLVRDQARSVDRVNVTDVPFPGSVGMLLR